MNRLLTTSVAVFSIAGGCAAAFAADMPARPYAPGAAPAAVSSPGLPDWTGFYIGINGGGGWAHSNFDTANFNEININIPNQHPDPTATASFGNITPPGLSASGGIFGGHAGYNWQWGSVVGGLELDVDGANIKASQTFVQPNFAITTSNGAVTGVPSPTFTNQLKIDALASVRARLGWLLIPNLLAYGTAGLAFGHGEFNSTASWTPISTDRLTVNITDATNSNFNELGWAAGAGLEWMMFPRWLLRVEYLHYDFGKITVPEPTGLIIVPENVNIRTTVDTVRAGISYKF
jgi:outer membrane immunogenic protein